MRYFLAGAALAALAAPAAARDNSAYFGLEVGATFPHDSHVRLGSTGANVININHKLGVDGDLIAGYDFGIFRAEFEAGHKWSKVKNLDLPSGVGIGGIGHTSGYSTMVNAMVDLRKKDSFKFYVRGGGRPTLIHHRAERGTPPTTPRVVDIDRKKQVG